MSLKLLPKNIIVLHDRPECPAIYNAIIVVIELEIEIIFDREWSIILWQVMHSWPSFDIFTNKFCNDSFENNGPAQLF